MAKIYTLKVPLKEVQKVKKKLISVNLFAGDYEFVKTKTDAFIPVDGKAKSKILRLLPMYKLVQKELKILKKETNLKKILSS
ncbi:hypothetical protein DRJ25_04655, partial [Candidatus Woesearchaeota archaeon]